MPITASLIANGNEWYTRTRKASFDRTGVEDLDCEINMPSQIGIERRHVGRTVRKAFGRDLQAEKTGIQQTGLDFV